MNLYIESTSTNFTINYIPLKDNSVMSIYDQENDSILYYMALLNIRFWLVSHGILRSVIFL